MTWFQLIGLIEAVIILVMAEPSLNRMSPCAPLIIRLAFHAMAIGSAFRIYHIASGHDPSWSAVVQTAGLCFLLIVDLLRKKQKQSKRLTRTKSNCVCPNTPTSIPPSRF